ncbi:hypothetical protein BD410DRAFT_786287 [Rickenella mellea]|uniref:Tyrosine--tRNA ligase n=1 Tax=Rickenella mellea TaxID=50990 RepID=A0A4Y7QA01_9AGAM|nr:hypothetical protein BD410DRAFT_786287 [Rickenella mellea]
MLFYSNLARFRFFCRRHCRSIHVGDGLLQELYSRALVADVTRPQKLADELRHGPRAVYVGVDPTAASLHVGHLVPLMCALHFHLRGHRVIPLIGGATGLIGDPSGRLHERRLLETTQLHDNVSNLKRAVEKFFSVGRNYAEHRLQGTFAGNSDPEAANNMHWLGDLSLLDFLNVAGKHSRVNTMIARESVQSRMTSQQGISFTEFTYQLLQAYDFYHLHRNFGCTIQIGGTDQWGNMLAGIDLIQKANEGAEGRSTDAYGVTTPLLTTASGDKFGKSDGNAVWLDSDMTSVFEFYQFFLKTPDSDVGKYLKMFSLLPLERIDSALSEHTNSPEKHIAQRLLADEVTELVHGTDGVRRAHAATHALFETDLSQVDAGDIVSALTGDPRLVPCSHAEVMEKQIALLATTYNLTKSNAEARRLAESKGLYLNNRFVSKGETLQPHHLLQGKVAILRAGKDKHVVLAVR